MWRWSNVRPWRWINVDIGLDLLFDRRLNCDVIIVTLIQRHKCDVDPTSDHDDIGFARICGKNIMMVPVFIYNIITVDFYQLWLNLNVTSTKNIDVISTTLFRRFFDIASTKNIDVISTTLFRRLIDVVLRVMTSWRHSNVYSTSYRRHVPTGKLQAQPRSPLKCLNGRK